MAKARGCVGGGGGERGSFGVIDDVGDNTMMIG